MGREHSPDRIIRSRGRIEAGHFVAESEFDLHVDPSGRAMFVQFDEHPDNLPDGTEIRIELTGGRVLHCQVLGDSPLCTILVRP